MRGHALFPLLLVLAACTPAPRAPAPVAAPPALDEAGYRAAARAGRVVYRIAPGQGGAWVVVRRGGPLASLGHDHVVASRGLEGYVLWPADGTPGRADIRVDLRELEVDPADLRQEAGLDGTLDAEAVLGTARNMHDKVLDSHRFPYLVLRLRGVMEPAGGTVEGRLTLHGVTRPVALEVEAVREREVLRLAGRFRLRQSDFGITPFSVLGGALRVRNGLEGRFTVVARPWPGASR